ncbi:hypothetical protein B0H11DRAFT_2215761 [Mycena galericulata]|nr:hypothetical protein B0H11DRAFT_2215761 [Mycena galericulata]
MHPYALFPLFPLSSHRFSYSEPADAVADADVDVDWQLVPRHYPPMFAASYPASHQFTSFGRTDGEGIERAWYNLRVPGDEAPVRALAPGRRHTIAEMMVDEASTLQHWEMRRFSEARRSCFYDIGQRMVDRSRVILRRIDIKIAHTHLRRGILVKYARDASLVIQEAAT